jgi:hypothetical protein
MSDFKDCTAPCQWPDGVSDGIDSDGRVVVLVPVYRGKHPAKLFPDDYQRLLRNGYGHYWWLPNAKSPQVRSGGRFEARIVKRLIVEAKKGEKVFRIDSDPLNLRRDNLRVVQGRAAGTDLRSAGHGDALPDHS